MKIENDSRQLNYIAGNQVYILSQMEKATCAELIGRLSLYVNQLEPVYEMDSLDNITNPYILNTKNPIIDIYINSGGGMDSCLYSISSLLNIARSKGARIRTTVMHNASSCASMLAVQGDPGLRIMSENSYHFIHYGQSSAPANSEPGKYASREHDDHMNDLSKNVYLDNTLLSLDEINNMYKADTGFIYPKDCLKKGLCDWILTRNGKFIGRNTER